MMFEIQAAFSGFSVNDLAAAKDFYVNKLGLNLASEDMGLHFALPGGGSVYIYDKPDHQSATYTVLNLIVDNIDQAVDGLVQRGVVFEHYDNMPAPQDEKGILRGLAANQGPDIAWFKDPAGNILSVIQDVSSGGQSNQPGFGVSQKIVIVEDNIALAEIYKTRLELLGYTVAVANDGRAGLDLIHDTLPNLVLLDLMVPKMAGDQILENMRNSDWGKNIKVAIISNLNESDAPAGLRNMGIEAYAVKANLSNDQLDQLVDSILKPQGQQEDVSLEAPTT